MERWRQYRVLAACAHTRSSLAESTLPGVGRVGAPGLLPPAWETGDRRVAGELGTLPKETDFADCSSRL